MEGLNWNSAPMFFRLSWLTLILLGVRLVRHWALLRTTLKLEFMEYRELMEGRMNHVICVIVNLNPIFKNICLMVDIPMFLGMTNYNRNFRLHIHHEQILLYICMGIILIRTRRNIVKLPELLSGLFHGN